jgi:MSHA biogenesis protein MshJ
MKEQLNQLATRINALHLRERALLLLAGVAIVFVLIDTFGLQPTYKQQQQSRQEIDDLEQQLATLSARSQILYALQGTHELQEYEQERSQLQAEISELEARLQGQLGVLLQPEQAARVLEQVLGPDQELKLTRMDAVGRPLNPTPTADGGDPAETGIGRYELRLQLEGSYLATLRYLRALEALPWKFFWEQLDFEVQEHPVAQVTLDIYTLGLLEG